MLLHVEGAWITAKARVPLSRDDRNNLSIEIHLALVTIPTITPILENLHHTLDPLKYVIIHVPMTNQPEKRNRIPDSCATREKIREWAPIMPTQGELGYKDGFQCG